MLIALIYRSSDYYSFSAAQGSHRNRLYDRVVSNALSLL